MEQKKFCKLITVDNFNKVCNCGGTFKETSLHDDWEGVLHCSKCGLEVERYIKVPDGWVK